MIHLSEHEHVDCPRTSPILGVITTLITIATVGGNLTTLVTMRQCRGLHPSHKFLLTILSTLCLLIGIFHMSFVSVACFTGHWLGMGHVNATNSTQIVNNTTWCRISSHILLPLVKLSIATVTIISLERFVALKFTYQYYRLTTRKLVVIVTVIFVGVLSMTVFEISREQGSVYMVPAYQCMPLYGKISDIEGILYVNVVYKAVCHGLVLVVNTYTLVKIILLNRYARYHLGGSRDERRKLFTVSVLILTTLDTLTWLPVYLLSILRHENSTLLVNMSTETLLKLRTVTWWLLYVSPTINPLLYVLRFRDVRLTVKTGVRGSVDRISSFGRRMSASMSSRRLSTSSNERRLAQTPSSVATSASFNGEKCLSSSSRNLNFAATSSSKNILHVANSSSRNLQSSTSSTRNLSSMMLNKERSSPSRAKVTRFDNRRVSNLVRSSSIKLDVEDSSQG